MTIGKLLGRGQVAEVFEFGPHAIKLFRSARGKVSAFREAATLVTLEGSGLPVPVVHEIGCFGGRWGLVISRAPDSPIPFPADPATLASLHVRLHKLHGARLGSLKQKLALEIGRAALLSLPESRALLSYLAELPDGDRLCHGDFHPGNIMGSSDEPFVVDWVDATQGAPEADACRSYLLALHNLPDFAEPYLSAYAALSGVPRDAVLAWLPVLAAARLSENVVAENERLLLLAKAISNQH